MCDLDWAGKKGMTSPTMKDSGQREGDEPFNAVQECQLISLGVLGHLATDPEQYHVKNLMREVACATCGTLDRARRVRYLVR